MSGNDLAKYQALARELFETLASARELRSQGRSPEARKAEAQAARAMSAGPLHRYIEYFFRKRHVPEAEAEELAMDVWTKLLSADYAVTDQPFAYLRRMAISRFADYVRHRHATGEATQVVDPFEGREVEEDEQASLLERSAGSMPMAEDFEDCVRRKSDALRAAAPQRMALLELVAQGFTSAEMAAATYGVPLEAVTKKMEGNVRDRVYQARKQAAVLFEDCKE